MKYAWIRSNRHTYAVSTMCQVLEVSASGYHEQLKRKPTSTSTRLSNDALLALIQSVHAQFKREYGWPKMWRELVNRGYRVGKERVRRLMQLHGIRARTKRKFKVTTESKHSLPIAPNLLQRNFWPAKPNQVWTSDITYIWTDEGWLFVAVYLDLFNRQVVGWSIKPQMKADLVIDALRMGWFRRSPAQGLIVHTDRGSQYCSSDFQTVLKAYGMTSSMSGKGDCWDNAPTESFWSRLKAARIHGNRMTTREQARHIVLDWIAFYNAHRLHSSLGYVSPMQYERKWEQQQADLAKQVAS